MRKKIELILRILTAVLAAALAVLWYLDGNIAITVLAALLAVLNTVAAILGAKAKD